MEPTARKKKRFLGLKIGLGVFFGLWAALLVVLHIVLSTSFLTKIANKYAAEFVDGQVSFGSISASMFKSFPNLNVSIDDFTLTYPHERFAAYDSIGIAHHLRDAGRAGTMDTLASFRNLSVAVNYMAAMKGDFRIPGASLDGARIFAHKLDSTTVNWDMFRFSTDEDDTTSTVLPKIVIRKLALTGNPYVTFDSAQDTLFASLAMDQTIFDGKLDISDPWKSRIGFRIDSLDVEGRLPADTMSFNLNRFTIDEKKEVYQIGLDARARLATEALGRFDLPATLSCSLSFPDRDFNAFSIRDLVADIATLDITGEGDVRMQQDSSYVRAELSVNECPVEQTVREYLSNIVPEALKLKTDAAVTLTALCDGWWIPSKNALPELIAEVVVPRSAVSYQGYPYKGLLAADISAQTDRYGKLGVVVNEFQADIAGISLNATGSADDLLCGDPLIGLDAKAKASLDIVNDFLPEGIEAKGTLEGNLEGFILLSDMSLYNFSRADLEGYVRSDGIVINDRPDSIYAFIDNADIRLGKAGKDAKLGADLLGLKASVDSLYATIGKATFFRGRGFTMTAQNAKETLSEEYGKEIHPIVGTVGAAHIAMTGADSLLVGVSSTANSFKYSNRKDDGKTLPILAFNSRNESISFRQGVNRASLNGAAFNASALRHGARRDGMKRHFLDSLQKVYPGVPRDSLIGRMVRRKNIPYYLSEDDFRKSDIDMKLNETFAKYFQEWAISGKLDIADGNVITPYFPLRNVISNAEGKFTNNQIDLSNMTIISGESDVSVSGKVSGLKRALTENGVLNIDLKVLSDRINTNELLAAYTAGTQYVKPASSLAFDESKTDAQYMEEVISTDMASADTSYSLIVIPANINATLSLEGHEIDYSHLIVDWFESDIKMKERTLQITNTVATSNMGDIYLEGFYSSQTKKDISAAFDLNLVDITADKVITLFPAVDSLIPMLKSFKGMLDCEMAATSQLDTNMNFIPSTINGVLKIGGRDLSIEEDGGLKKLAKVLMFKDKKVGRVDKMSVQGLISNNMLEIFPFVLDIDRYTLAMNGIQNFDQSFKYHVSVLKSPIPFRFGINLTGNFDDWKYKIGKAKYKNVNVPVFTTELRDVQYNLIGSIHDIFERGVMLAMQDNEASISSVDEAKSAAGYDGNEDDGDLEDRELESIEQIMNSESEEESDD